MPCIAHGERVVAYFLPTAHKTGEAAYVGESFLYVVCGDFVTFFQKLAQGGKYGAGVFYLVFPGKFTIDYAIIGRGVLDAFLRGLGRY